VPPTLALLLWFVLLLGLLLFDPAKDPETSLALWVPLIWVCIIASRLPSQWMGGSVGSAMQAFEEGNSLDRSVFLFLIALAVGILAARSFNWGSFFARNVFLMLFLFFALLSVIWSDFPFVSLKRWIRDLGHYLVVLVVLSDPRPFEAIRTLLRRLCYILIPLSVVFAKYFPALGRRYSYWTGAGVFVGAASDKNNLGVLCLISGIFFIWDTVIRWSSRKDRRVKRIIIVNIAFIAMTLWLLHYGDSATSSVCLAVGCLVILAAHSRMGRRHLTFLKVMIPVALCVCLIITFAFGINRELTAAVGRNATLTDRTDLWKVLLSMHTNPLVGTGYEGFWLGPRFKWISETFAEVNEAHNGYLEVYLNLGGIGLLLLGGFLMSSYRMICRRLTTTFSLGSLSLALWIVVILYNITEAAFKFQLMWVIFLLLAMVVPERVEQRVRAHPVSDKPRTAKQFPGPSPETKALRWRQLDRSSNRRI
jgi:exopolysaccharide production protein ExoQ